MIIHCPSCGYSRKPTDTTPPGECPGCGIDFKKFLSQPKSPSPTTSAKTVVGPSAHRESRTAPLIQRASTPRPEATARDAVLPKARRIQILTLVLVIAACGLGFKLYSDHQLKQRRATLAETHKKQQAEVDAILVKWKDALSLAGMTSRIALAQPLSQMQSIRREMSAIKYDECSDKATKEIVSGMDNALFAFEMFVRYPSNSSASDTTSSYLDKSVTGVAAGKAQLRECMAKAVSALEAN